MRDHRFAERAVDCPSHHHLRTDAVVGDLDCFGLDLVVGKIADWRPAAAVRPEKLQSLRMKLKIIAGIMSKFRI